MAQAALLEELGSRLRQLGESLEGVRDRDGVLREIFAINKTIGMMLKEEPGSRDELSELQRWVNLVTVGVKSSDAPKARQGLEGALRLFERMARERGSAKGIYSETRSF